MNNVVINKELRRKVRSISNNNPLNIKRNARNRWFGAKSNQTDKVFEEFEDLEYGVRAALIILKKYIDSNSGANTIFVLIGLLVVLIPVLAISMYYAYGSDPMLHFIEM